MLGYLVWLRDPRNIVNRTFTVFCALAAYLSFTGFGLYQADSLQTAYFWLKAGTFWPLLLPALLHFALAFTGQSKLLRKRATYVILYAPALVFSFLGLTTGLLLSGPTKEYWGWSAIHTGGAASYITSSWVIIVSVLSLYLCLRYYLRTTEPHERQRVKFALVGISIPLLSGIITQDVLPALQVKFPEMTTLAFTIGAVFIGYGIWKYRLFTLTAATAAESIISTMSHFLFLVSPEGRIVKANQAALRALGYKEEELTGREVGVIFAEGGDAKFLFNYSGLTGQPTSDATKNTETTMKTKAGMHIPTSVSTSTVRTDDGSIQGIILVAEDITERKQMEEKLKKAHEGLEALVEERTTELTKANKSLQAEITERKRMDETLQKTIAGLERSNAELERFAYIASHDLQEPLRMIASYTQLLEKRYKDRLDGDAHDFIGYAVDGAKRMQQLINDLLTYSRVGTRGQPFESTDSMTVFQAAVANLDVTIRESGAEVTSDPLPTVMADRGQLVQLFQNLIENAVKFHGEEPPRVHVSAEQKGDEWLFSVRDNGIGIEPQYSEQVFRVFQRLHGREYPGTGIGLSIAKRVVERHRGRIWLESQPGKGTTVYFVIPEKGGQQ